MSGAWPDDCVPVPAPTVHHAFFDGEAVLYLADHARPVLLNHTAATVWAAIDGQASVAEIAATLAALFDADQATVRADLERTLDTFVELGVIDARRA